MEPFQERQDLVLGQLVEARQWLVHQQQLGLGEERAADGDTLTLAAGQMAWRAIQQLAEAQQVHDLIETDGVGVKTLRGAVDKIAAHVQMRKEAGLLEYIANRTLMNGPKTGRILPDVATYCEVAVGDAVESRNGAQQTCLAAAGGAEQRCHATGGNLKFHFKREVA